jgi:hypothetical protein
MHILAVKSFASFPESKKLSSFRVEEQVLQLKSRAIASRRIASFSFDNPNAES